jgi:hypothetical protein
MQNYTGLQLDGVFLDLLREVFLLVLIIILILLTQIWSADGKWTAIFGSVATLAGVTFGLIQWDSYP